MRKYDFILKFLPLNLRLIKLTNLKTSLQPVSKQSCTPFWKSLDLDQAVLSKLDAEFEHAYAKLVHDYDQRPTAGLCGLNQAVSYALTGQGKKVRPWLCMLTNYALEGISGNAVSASLALEMIHVYSLVHDDLPAMDDDDFRRHRPTVHKQFDDATAILAGDALLSDAFTVLSEWPTNLLPAQRLAQIKVLSRAAGSLGMVLGQSLDIDHTGSTSSKSLEREPSRLESIHRHKTGALIGASLALGSLSASLDEKRAQKFFEAGEKIGLAYQILDDVLDDTPNTGKTAGKDKAAQKTSYLSLYGKDIATQKAQKLTDEAIDIISGYTSHDILNKFILGLLNRAL